MVKIDTDWPEMLIIFTIIIGVTLAVLSANTPTLYFISFLTGLIFGRMWHKYKTSQCVPLFLVIAGFFLGFILGGIYANLRLITILLLAGILISYWIHDKKIIRSW